MPNGIAQIALVGTAEEAMVAAKLVEWMEALELASKAMLLVGMVVADKGAVETAAGETMRFGLALAALEQEGTGAAANVVSERAGPVVPIVSQNATVAVSV